VSPTARSLAYLREKGYRAQVVERWIPQARKRVDLFGFGDIVCLDGCPGVLAVQVTTASNLSNRLKKLRTECKQAAWDWLEHENALHLHGWSKKGARGKRKTWQLTVRTITLADLDREE
jgi:hypothetical protein